MSSREIEDLWKTSGQDKMNLSWNKKNMGCKHCRICRKNWILVVGLRIYTINWVLGLRYSKCIESYRSGQDTSTTWWSLVLLVCWMFLWFVCTLEQTLLVPTRFQPSAHWGGVWVGGGTVATAPSATCLQMYFSWLVQGSRSHSPAEIPVAMATQPCS